MLPKSVFYFFKNLSAKFHLSSTSLLILCIITLSSCEVPPSFGYAFGGTCAVMLVGLMIATFVTSRNKKRDGEGK
jgi:hypothetical protein